MRLFRFFLCLASGDVIGVAIGMAPSKPTEGGLTINFAMRLVAPPKEKKN
jgi:hypothetical protein